MKRSIPLILMAALWVLMSCVPVEEPTASPTSTPTLLPATPSSEGGTTPTAVPAQPSPTPLPEGGRPIVDTVSVSFAAYRPLPVQVTPAVPEYSTDPDRVANPRVLRRLNEAQRTHLARHGFVVIPEGAEQMYTVYKQAKDAGIPVLVTTDSLLHTFHVIYDYALRAAEIEHFVLDLDVLNKAMLERALSTMSESSDASSQEASRRNAAFFAVASVLLEPGAQVPQQVQDVVKQEIALIEAHRGFAQSPIFGYSEDYSQYVPRGHYTRNETFERYFRCMMWYGRMGFHPTTRDTEQARRETRQAMMITAALFDTPLDGGQAIDVWERIYEPTVFFVGRADDLSPRDYQQLAQSLFGTGLAGAIWEDDEELDRFRQATRELPPPRIVSGQVKDTEDTEEETRSFRFMGQRFVYDSYVFQQLVYDQVGQYHGSSKPFTLSPSDAGSIRGIPRGLDIAAVFGSQRALDILTQEGDTQYQGYDEQMARLRGETQGLPQEQWVENLYWGWMYSLRPLLTPKGEGYPLFMRSPSWLDKDLFAFLGSWTELRHDTILYAKQSYTIRATSVEAPPETARGYVEPQPEVYARLAALAHQMRTGLGQRGLLNAEFAGKMTELEEVLTRLKTISERELSSQTLDEDEYTFIQNIGTVLERLGQFSEEVEQGMSSKTDDKMSIVADVHTDTNTQEVLEQAVGPAFTVFAIVPDGNSGGDRTQVAIGPILSQYEFRQPMSERLTDEVWQSMTKPPLSPWTSSFIVR